MSVLNQEQRKQSATIVKDTGDGKKYMFPMPDKNHARNALARLDQAKDLTPADKAKIKARANEMLHHKSNYSKDAVHMALQKAQL